MYRKDEEHMEYKIAICDDQKYFMEEIKNIIKNFEYKRKDKFSIYTFDSGRKFLEAKESFDIVFMDLDFDNDNELDGLEVVKKRKENVEDEIYIILTSHLEHISKGYYVNAYRYLIKPLKEDELEECITSITRQREKQIKLKILDDGKTIVILANDILHIEADGKTLVLEQKIHTFLRII